MGQASFDFASQTVIVTGAARGIGLEFSRTFAAAGAEVVMVDLDAEALTAAAAEVGGTAVPDDVTDTMAVEGIVTDAETQIPLGRFGEPAEMAAIAAFLASDQAAYITGTVVAVDGGLSM